MDSGERGVKSLLVNITILRNIASDAASILDRRLGDKRRSKPFTALAERMDDRLAHDLRETLERERKSLNPKHSAVAEEISELIRRVDALE